MKKNPLFWIGATFLAFLVLFAIFGPHLHPGGYLDKVGRPFQPPGDGLWLGADEQGRNVFARLAFGARISLFIGVSVMAIALVVGIFLGVSAVYGPRWLRVVILRLTDGMFAFPDILLAILIIGILDRGLVPVIAALAITAWPGVVRLVRTQVATLKDREFVVASEALGASRFYTVTRHVLPHLTGTLLAVSMVDLAGVILAESALNFLGIGLDPRVPTWGGMINNARFDMNQHPMLLFWPCLLLSATIFALNFLGDGLRSLTDPKSSR